MGRHIDELERRFDGAIPREMLRSAQKRDTEEALAARTTAPRPAYISPRKPARPAGVIVRQIARIMVDRAAGSEACAESDLAAAGFTAAEIAAHADAARGLARRHTADRRAA